MLLCVPAAHAFDSESTGADGVLNPAVSTEIELPPSGILNYTSVNIPTGVTVTFKKNALNTPVQILASGDITITGTIDIRGGTAKPTGTAGDGNQGDDGLPGLGGPGGFDGGRGGKDDLQARADVIIGGSGLGPGGGRGGYQRAHGCFGGVYSHSEGSSAGYATKGSGAASGSCTEVADEPERGQPYGTPELLPLIGGSGGGGGRGGTNYPGVGGGGGGGAILLAASGALTVTGAINATGGDTAQGVGTGVGAFGGAGSGGAIKLMATSIKGNGSLVALGGCLFFNGVARQHCSTRNGSAEYLQGGDGRIRIEGENITFSGSSQPAYTRSLPKPIATTDLPSIRIASIAGVNVPTNPTGSADVSLPATTTDPVIVTFATANVPTGNAIKLRIVPAYGVPIEVLSPAISGTVASGSASVSVTPPQGPSVLQAVTSYTITVAQAESLSQYANDERVERVELVASMGRDSAVELTTASGKRYIVPAAVLKIVGLAG